jgi:hypothetical protein
MNCPRDLVIQGHHHPQKMMRRHNLKIILIHLLRNALIKSGSEAVGLLDWDSDQFIPKPSGNQ